MEYFDSEVLAGQGIQETVKVEELDLLCGSDD